MSSKTPIVKQVAWAFLIPQFFIVGTILFIWWHFYPRGGLFFGVLTYLILAFSLQNLIGRFQRAGMKKIKPLCKKNPAISIWVSWYKKTAKIPTDVTEDVIRNYALKNDLVDVKANRAHDENGLCSVAVNVARHERASHALVDIRCGESFSGAQRLRAIFPFGAMIHSSFHLNYPFG